MILNDHLLYIDVTNQCELDCAFCMYKKERLQNPQNLNLNINAKQNLSNLINDPETGYIIISGEGEPINNLQTIYDILELSSGNNKFQIISNGIWIHERGENILSTLNNMAKIKKDKYAIRLSLDSHHYPQVNLLNYKSFFMFALENEFPCIEFSLRSVKEDQRFVIEKLGELLEELAFEFNLLSESKTDDAIFIADKKISINYRNIVYPREINSVDCFSIWDYMHALEDKYGKRFSMGNITANSKSIGLDITIKPDGSIFFYGMEIEPLGNILKDNISIPYLKKRIQDTKLFEALYSKPLIPILMELAEDFNLRDCIEEVNNPYWVVRELYLKYQSKFDKVLGLK